MILRGNTPAPEVTGWEAVIIDCIKYTTASILQPVRVVGVFFMMVVLYNYLSVSLTHTMLLTIIFVVTLIPLIRIFEARYLSRVYNSAGTA